MEVEREIPLCPMNLIKIRFRIILTTTERMPALRGEFESFSEKKYLNKTTIPPKKEAQ